MTVPRAGDGRGERLLTRQFSLVMAGTAAAWFAHTMATMLMAPFAVELGLDASVGGFLLATNAISALVARMVVGPRLDGQDGRFVTIAGAALIAAGTTGYLATALLAGPGGVLLPLAIGGAVLHGAGFGAMSTSTFTIVGDAAPVSRRGEAVGYYGAAPPIIQGIAATIGFVLVDLGGYPLLYAVVVAGAVGGMLLFAGLRPIEQLPSAILPTPPLHLLGAIAVPILAVGLLPLVSGALTLAIPLVGLAAGISNPGVFYLASAVSGVLGRLVAGGLSDRHGRIRIAAPGLLLLTVTLAVLVATVSGGIVVFAVAGFFTGVAFAAAVPTLQALVLDRSPAGQRGTAAAAMGMALDLGFATGSVLTGIVIGAAGAGPALLVAAAAPLLAVALLAVDQATRPRVRRA